MTQQTSSEPRLAKFGIRCAECHHIKNNEYTLTVTYLEDEIYQLI